MKIWDYKKFLHHLGKMPGLAFSLNTDLARYMDRLRLWPGMPILQNALDIDNIYY